MHLPARVSFDLAVARASFPLAALGLALLGQRGALNLALASVVLYVVSPLELPRSLGAAVLVAAAVLAWGNALSLYGHVLYYDIIAHFLVQLLIAPVLFYLVARGPSLAAATSIQTLALTFALGLALGSLWEILEWSSDGLVGTNFVKGEADTATDLIADALGALLAGARLAGLQPAARQRHFALDGGPAAEN